MDVLIPDTVLQAVKLGGKLLNLLFQSQHFFSAVSLDLI